MRLPCPLPLSYVCKVRKNYYSVAVVNAQGELVYRTGNPQDKIDLTGSQAGVYFIHYTTDSEKMMRQIVVQN